MSGPTILLVDDEPFILDEVASLLESEGYCVVTADNYSQALTLVEQHPSLLLVITDMRMPGKSGIDLISQLQGRNLAFILMSGHLETWGAAPTQVPLFTKPLDIDAMLEAVAGAHRR